MQIIDTQLKHNDCGISVIKTIANLYRAPIRRSDIERTVPLDSQGSRFGDIERFLTLHGFDTSFQLLDLNINTQSYYKERLPFILPTLNKGSVHFVVVHRLRKGKFEILDPLDSAPYYLTRSELRKRAYTSENKLKHLDSQAQTIEMCRQLLSQYDINVESVVTEVRVDHLFNKVNYFIYIKDEFGFKNEETEKKFLIDLLYNQDITQLPQQFHFLTIKDSKAAIKAPVILSIKKYTADEQQHSNQVKEQNPFVTLYQHLGGYKKHVAWFIAISLASVAFSQLFVFINQYFLDTILALKKTSLIGTFMLGLIAYKIFDLLLYMGKKWIGIYVSLHLDRLFLTTLDARLNRYSLAFIQGYKKGDLTERLSDATKLKTFFTKYLVNILVDVAVSIYILAVLAYLNWKLTIIVFAVTALFYGWFKWITPYLQRNEQLRFARKSEFFSTMFEKLEGIQTLKALNCDGIFSQKIHSTIESLLDIQKRTQKLGLLNGFVITTITLVATASLTALLAYESTALNTLTLGQVVTFLALSSRIFASLSGLLDDNLTLQENQVILKRYFSFKEELPALKPENKAFTETFEQLELRDVCFGYHPEEPVIKDISLTINKGDKIRVEGKNGSGKSTLSKVLALLYPAHSGSITINGKKIETLAADDVKKKILLVSNEDILFNDSLLYNLTFQNAVWPTKIDELAKGLGLDAWIGHSTMQNSHYRISESGKNLSTGQRKKILLLRALLHEAELIILDEVLSGIDVESRRFIESYLNSITDKTFIFISHESIKNITFNKTYTLKKGRLTEHTPNTGDDA